MAEKRKFLVALLAPAFVAVYPFFVDGWDLKTDLGPVVVALLVAYGVYRVPNQEARVGKQVRS